MIVTVKYYQALCDGCKAYLEMMEEYSALNDIGAVRDEVSNSDWSMVENGKIYCPDCHTTKWNEDEDKLLAFTKDMQNSGATLLGEVV